MMLIDKFNNLDILHDKSFVLSPINTFNFDFKSKLACWFPFVSQLDCLILILVQLVIQMREIKLGLANMVILSQILIIHDDFHDLCLTIEGHLIGPNRLKSSPLAYAALLLFFPNFNNNIRVLLTEKIFVFEECS